MIINGISGETYWILNSVVDLMYPLRVIASEDISFHFNKPGPDLSFGEMARLLLSMVRQGHIHLQKVEGQYIIEEYPNPNLDFVISSMQEDTGINYGLTLKGGEEWERLSKPIWSRYINVSIDPLQGVGEISSMSPDIIRLLSDNQNKLQRTTVTFEKWSFISPWRATYWKTIDNGCRMWFKFEENPNATVVSEEERLQWVIEHEKIFKWYTNPFD